VPRSHAWPCANLIFGLAAVVSLGSIRWCNFLWNRGRYRKVET
jgi:hypothetical protein